jgi:hypothetical protein
VAVEYFTKWVEVKPVTNVSSATIKKLWQNIICHYGVPRQITINNAKYFDSIMFKDFYQQVGMKVTFTSVYHPQSNGAIERANALIFEAIKKILEGEKKANGRRSCQGQYGVTTQQSAGQQISHHSDCCTRLKQYCQKKSRNP